ncbi:Aspartyl/glutamyl-tRNA(Asn/Gln) amidotransferase subunit [Dirofilaria immitis]
MFRVSVCTMNQNLVPTYFQTGNISNSAPQQVEHVVIGDRVSILKDETKSTMQEHSRHDDMWHRGTLNTSTRQSDTWH